MNLSFWRTCLRRFSRGASDTGSVPCTLDEAVSYLAAYMTNEDKRLFAAAPEGDYAARCHMSTGMQMRNDWGLWHNETPLTRWLRDHGIHHGDDRYAVISKALWCRLNNVSFDIAAEAAHYKDYWERSAKAEAKGSYTVRLDKDGRVEWENET